MVPINIRVSNGSYRLVRPAVFDTGFTAGLLLPKSVARSLRAVLTTPRRLPRTISGRPVRGQSTILEVAIPAAAVRAQTLVFCPDETPSDTLIGEFYLAQVRASLLVGKISYDFVAPNADPELFDWGNVTIPIDRPKGPWL